VRLRSHVVIRTTLLDAVPDCRRVLRWLLLRCGTLQPVVKSGLLLCALLTREHRAFACLFAAFRGPFARLRCLALGGALARHAGEFPPVFLTLGHRVALQARLRLHVVTRRRLFASCIALLLAHRAELVPVRIVVVLLGECRREAARSEQRGKQDGGRCAGNGKVDHGGLQAARTPRAGYEQLTIERMNRG